jgi:hypothetical protein
MNKLLPNPNPCNHESLREQVEEPAQYAKPYTALLKSQQLEMYLHNLPLMTTLVYHGIHMDKQDLLSPKPATCLLGYLSCFQIINKWHVVSFGWL